MTALSKGEPDRVPIFEAYINEPVIVRLAELLMPGSVKVKASHDRSGEERIEIMDLYCRIVSELDLDSTCTLFSTGLKLLADGHGQDKFGTVWSLSEHGEPLPVDGPVKALSDLEGFDMATRLEPKDF